MMAKNAVPLHLGVAFGRRRRASGFSGCLRCRAIAALAWKTNVSQGDGGCKSLGVIYLRAWLRSSRGSWGRQQGRREVHALSVVFFGQKTADEKEGKGGGGSWGGLHLLDATLPRAIGMAVTASRFRDNATQHKALQRNARGAVLSALKRASLPPSVAFFPWPRCVPSGGRGVHGGILGRGGRRLSSFALSLKQD
jgi:hypothetical protein